MQILGIDPGYATTGFGVLQAGQGQLHLLNYGTITTPAGLTLSRRLVMLYDDTMELLRELNRQGCTILLVTHEERYADMCSRKIRMTDGCAAEA